MLMHIVEYKPESLAGCLCRLKPLSSYFYFFAEVEAKRPGSSAHSERALPGQSEHERTSGHHAVSPPDGQPVMGATGYRLKQAGRGEKEDSGSPQKDARESVKLLRDRLIKEKEKRGGGYFFDVNLWLLILRPC